MPFSHVEFTNHEQVLFCTEPSVGLQAIIAVHDSSLGPAAGGCRMQPYASIDDALGDVLRLSRAMSYKNAMAGLPLGGGKCVIIADPETAAKPDLLRAFAYHVQSLGGRFWTAIDVGVGPADADILAENCDYIFANAARYEPGFDPSTYTALGGFVALRAAAAHVWGSSDLSGRRVAIAGLGATGSRLASHLANSGAELVVADIDPDAVAKVVEAHGATAVDPSVIHAQDVDIYAPCAMGGAINDTTVGQLQASIVCGLANNQLERLEHGFALHELEVTYVPDFVANSGGMIGAGAAIFSNPSNDEIHRRVLGVFDTVSGILVTARREQITTAEVALRTAHARITAAGAKRESARLRRALNARP